MFTSHRVTSQDINTPILGLPLFIVYNNERENERQLTHLDWSSTQRSFRLFKVEHI